MFKWFGKKKESDDLPPPPKPMSHELPKAEDVEPSATPAKPETKPAPSNPVPPPEPKEPPKPTAIPKPEEHFIEQNQYEQMLEATADVEGALERSKAALQELERIKSEGDGTLEEWRAQLEDAERKLLYIDKVLFEQ